MDNNESFVWEENIRTVCKRQDAARNQIRVCAEELAALIVNSEDVGEVDEMYREFCRRAVGVGEAEKALLCKLICSREELRTSVADRNVYGNGEAPPTNAYGRIAYMRNKRSDDAFLRLSKTRKTARASYVGTFAEACEAVYNGLCEYCILPVENEREGRLYSFYSMIDRYELKICDTVTVSSEDSSESIRFALVGRRVNGTFAGNGKLRLDFSVITEAPQVVSNVISVVDAFKGKLISVGIQPVPYDLLRNTYYFCAELEKNDSVAVALYLGEEYPRCSILGLYGADEK